MELWLDSARVALRSFASQRLRTALVALSIAIGAGGVSLLVSLGKSGFATILHGVEAVGGSRLMFLFEKGDERDRPTVYDQGLTLADVRELRTRVPGLRRVSFMNFARKQLAFGGGRQAEVDVAIGEDWLRFLQQRLTYGVAIPADREESDARVVALGEGLARKLFDSPETALGQHLTLWGHHYKILGVTTGQPAPGFHMGGVEVDRAVYVSPYAAAKHEGIAESADDLILESDGTVSHEHIMRVVDSILLARHRVVDWDFFDMKPLLSKFEQVFLVLRLVIGLIAAVAMFIAGAGIMNVLLASVRERVTEIGVRRAVGASQRDVRRQFLVESATLGLVGGLAGAVAGLGAAWVLGQLVALAFPIWQTQVSLLAGLTGVLMAVACGLAFGVVPARRAGRLDVVACLRGDV